jgi:uncharacterized protein (DUF2164 family)
MKKKERLLCINLSNAQKQQLKDEIKAFYIDERGEEVNIIEQMQILNLFEEKMAPIIYNQALDDAKKWFVKMMDNLDCDYGTLYKNEN